MARNLIEQLGGRSFEHLGTTDRYKGRWQYLYAITDIELTYLDGDFTDLGASTFVGKTLVAGELLVGLFTEIELASGEAALYPEGDVGGLIARTVTYDDNTSDSGDVPTDAGHYAAGETIEVQDNSGTLVKAGYTFIGWNTAANGTGTDYAAGATLTFAGSNVTLYAQWEVEKSLTYDDNTSTGGSVPTESETFLIGESATVAGNSGTLVKTGGYKWVGWNTAANGTGTHYDEDDLLPFVGADITLYAEWELHHHVTYDGNTNTGGTVPTDATEYYAGDTVTGAANSGTLVKTGYSFRGWNTAADGSGTHIAVAGTFIFAGAALTLYAEWEASKAVTYDGNSNDAGSVPTDATAYYKEDLAPVAGNSGALARAGYRWAGWNTAADYTGTHYDHGQSVPMTAAVTLYAEWVAW